MSGNVTGPDGNNYTGLPEFCAVNILATPTSDSSINILLWMPTSTWNGRFEGTGNGGYGGNMALAADAFIYGIKHGFAVASTDLGTAPSANNDADTLIGHPEKWIDFGSRATVVMTTLSKQIIKAMHGRPPRHSYFTGCSTGGQQGLMMAQRYPGLYDGILAGDPAHDRTHVHTALLWLFAQTHQNANSYIPSDKVTLIANAILAACVAKSGGAPSDNFLIDPRKCDWQPSELRCTSQGQSNCLNDDQVRAATAIYDGARDPVTNKLLFPGNPKGSESASSFGWNANQVGLGAEPNFDSIFKWVFGPTWLYSDFDFHNDMKTMDKMLAHLLNATNPNLDRFRDKGGKLLMYHGWADSLAASQTSIDYFTNVVTRNGGGTYTSAAQVATQDYLRLFMVPGMNHCFGGAGAMVFGNQNAGNAGQDDVPTDDKNHHALLALVDWVENGNPPERIIATKYVSDWPGNGIAFQRPICPYPKVPTYNGTGDVKLATSFRCVYY